MDHSEATQQMAAERYLLNELTPELREAFEEHIFNCHECALDLQAGVAFIREAETQLPDLTPPAPSPSRTLPANPKKKKPRWFFIWQPAFAAPAFALLLIVIAYQNFATIPSLRFAANEPRLMPWASIHAGTRGAEHTSISADRKQGAALIIELPQQPLYTSYTFELYNSQNKTIWSHSVIASSSDSNGEAPLSLVIPGHVLQQSSYTLGIFGITSQAERTEIDRRVLDIHFNE